MDRIRLGRTNLMVSRSGFGALPIQRVTFEEAKVLLLKAYENGINFFDTARVYTDSEDKIGFALRDVRKEIFIATKSMASDKKKLLEDLETSLKKMKTDYIDIFQLHNPKVLPDPKDPNGLYSGLLEAKNKGLVRFIGITNHKLSTATEAAASGLYDTVQFPLSSLSNDKDLTLIEECRKRDVGIIAMKALSGGLITNAATTFTFLRQFNNLVPIWGIQKESELDEFLLLEKNPPALDQAMMDIINKDRAELSGAFCRGCGYCLPCPVGIEIPVASRMSLFIKRSVYQKFIEDGWRDKMELITKCINCGHCKDHCPYELDTPNLLKKELKKYREFCEAHENK